MLRVRPNLVKVAAVGALATFAFAVAAAAFAVAASTASASASTGGHQAAAAKQELTAAKAVVLGIVEGITEYLPISSSGHLLVTERLLNIGENKATRQAADTYTVVIQAGAILAVLLLSWKRVTAVLRGAIGRDVVGRRLLVALMIAFVPAALTGLVGESTIKEKLLEPIPVSIAWIVGAIAILAIGSKLHTRAQSSGRHLEAITNRDALTIGVVQILALWPGTSRSLVTILAALMLGLSLSAAVEFSFLLGLVTLGAATAKDLASHGAEMFDTYGVINPTIGFVVAFLAALVAVRWMITYLQHHSLNVFAYYRLAAAAVTITLVATNVL